MSATISLADGAPEGAGLLSVANETLDVRDGAKETDNESVIALARNVPYFVVTETEPETSEVIEGYDPSDPHQNPAADHLSIYGSEAAVAAAYANDLVIQTDHFGEEPPFLLGPRQRPTVAESIQETFRSQGITETPQVPEVADEAPAEAPQGSTEPAAPSTPAAGTGSGAWTSPTTTGVTD
jgi:hypothetical protein